MEDLIRDLENLIVVHLTNNNESEHLLAKRFARLYQIINQHRNQHKKSSIFDFAEIMYREQQDLKRNIDNDYKKVLDTILKILRGEINNIKLENMVDFGNKNIDEIIEEIRKLKEGK